MVLTDYYYYDSNSAIMYGVFERNHRVHNRCLQVIFLKQDSYPSPSQHLRCIDPRHFTALSYFCTTFLIIQECPQARHRVRKECPCTFQSISRIHPLSWLDACFHSLWIPKSLGRNFFNKVQQLLQRASVKSFIWSCFAPQSTQCDKDEDDGSYSRICNLTPLQ